MAAGTIVVLAAKDESPRQFNRKAKRALRAIGGQVDLSQHFRQGYVAVGVKGARRGSALEQLKMGEVARIGLCGEGGNGCQRIYLGQLTVRPGPMGP